MRKYEIKELRTIEKKHGYIFEYVATKNIDEGAWTRYALFLDKTRLRTFKPFSLLNLITYGFGRKHSIVPDKFQKRGLIL